MSGTARAAVVQKVQVVKDAATSIQVRTGKFAQKIGFPGVGRGPQRRELAALQGEVATWQPNEQAQVLADKLKDALDKLYVPGDRETQVAEAGATAAEVRKGLKALEESAAEAEKERKAALPSKSDLKALNTQKKTLTGQLDAAAEKIGTEPIGKVRFGRDRAQYEPLSLQAAAASIRTSIGSLRPDDSAKKIGEQIKALSDLIDEAKSEAEIELEYIAEDVTNRIEELKTIRKGYDNGVEGSYKGPLVRIIEVLASQVTASPAQPDAIRGLLQQADDEIAAAAFGGAAKSTAEEEKANAVEMRKRLESMLESWQVDLQRLIDIQAPNVKTVVDDLATLRRDADKPIAHRDMAQATLDMRAAVDTVREYAETLLQKHSDDVAAEAQQVQQALAQALKDFKAAYDAHGKGKVLQADYRAIDSQLGSAAAIVPASGALPANLSADDVALAKKLVNEASKSLASIKTNKDELSKFDEDAKAAAKTFDQRNFFGRQLDKITIIAPLREGSKGMLDQYDPKTCEELNKQLGAILKAMPHTPSKTSIAELQKLRDKAQTKIDELETAVAYIKDTASPKYKEMDEAYTAYRNADAGFDGASGGSATLKRLKHDQKAGLLIITPPVPKSYRDAMQALDKAIKDKPPVLLTLQAAVKAADDELAAVAAMGGGPGRGNVEGRLGAVYGEIDAEAKQEADDKKRQSTERKGLRRLEKEYDAAAKAVAATQGDRNALQPAGRLLTQIKDDIEAKRFDGLPEKRKQLEGRLKLLLANPRGEMNSRRKELPGVIAELRSAADGVEEAMRSVRGQLQQHAPADKAEKKSLIRAGNMVRRYRKLLDGRVDAMEAAAKPINDEKMVDEGARRAAREEGLGLLRAFRDTLRANPMTALLLASPFDEAKGSLGPLFRALDKYEYTLTTCI